MSEYQRHYQNLHIIPFSHPLSKWAVWPIDGLFNNVIYTTQPIWIFNFTDDWEVEWTISASKKHYIWILKVIKDMKKNITWRGC
jgi:hypothetical protein